VLSLFVNGAFNKESMFRSIIVYHRTALHHLLLSKIKQSVQRCAMRRSSWSFGKEESHFI